MAIAVLILSTPPLAGADEDPRSRRDEVRAERERLAGDLDSLQATDVEVVAALDVLDDAVASQEAQVADARRMVAEAIAEVDRAERAVEAKEAEIGALRAMVEQLAVSAYMDQPGDDPFLVLRAETATDAVQKQALLDLKANQDLDLVDRLSDARDDLEAERRLADEAAQDALDRQAEVEVRLAEVAEARRVQQDVLADVEERLNARLAEAQGLATLDSALSEQILAEERALAARVARQALERAPSVPSTVRRLGSGQLSSVRGFVVDSSITEQTEALLGAAESAGLSLGGGGYRNPDAQVALRRANCGSSEYAIYQMPASQCSPPTARPGTSMHEQGLALDLTSDGTLIRSRSNPAFQWLAANAAQYGFYNLPSEPWHWSTNGK